MPNYLTTLFFLLFFNAFGQNHVSWTFEYDDITQKVIAYGRIDSTWHVYSHHTNKNAGPIPVSMHIIETKGVKTKNKLEEISHTVKIFDKNFEAYVYYIDIIYVGQIKVKVKPGSIISGTVNYMVCNDIMCLPPIDVPFSLKI
ncbi:MAG: hypothetical protein EBS86_11030, partial [Crocinitomicaceae bacterium]|nr:hypothetical protein [Crocinitomicaceae bacterium]